MTVKQQGVLDAAYHSGCGTKQAGFVHSMTPADVLGFSRLSIDATVGMTEVVERMHQRITGHSLACLAGAGYASVRVIANLVGHGMDAVIAPLIALAGETQSSPEREAMLAAVNGILGDHLAATQNLLAVSM